MTSLEFKKEKKVIYEELGEIIQFLRDRIGLGENGLAIQLDSHRIVNLPLGDFPKRLMVVTVREVEEEGTRVFFSPDWFLQPEEKEKCVVLYEVGDNGQISVIRVGLFREESGVKPDEVKALIGTKEYQEYLNK